MFGLEVGAGPASRRSLRARIRAAIHLSLSIACARRRRAARCTRWSLDTTTKLRGAELARISSSIRSSASALPAENCTRRPSCSKLRT